MKKKVSKDTYDISPIKRETSCTQEISARKFHVVVVQNNGIEMYKKGAVHNHLRFLFVEQIYLAYR